VVADLDRGDRPASASQSVGSDQAWILGELIAYLEHDSAGASGFQDMGDKWVPVRDAARHGTLRASTPGVSQVAQRFDQFLQFLSLALSQELGREVVPLRGRKQTEEQHLDQLTKTLCRESKLAGAFRVPDAVAPVHLEADLRARTVTTSVTIDLPREGRPLARVNWLLRQLKGSPDDLRLTVGYANVRATASELLGRATARPELLLAAVDGKREPRWAQVALSRPLGAKRGRVPGSFVADTQKQAVDFYRDIVQGLKPWRPSAPKLPKEQSMDAAGVTDRPTVAVDREDAAEVGDAAALATARS
jgi:hypothetical protein